MKFLITKQGETLGLNEIEPSFVEIQAAVNKHFNLETGKYTISYIDVDDDPIAIEDDEDLQVCIFEFTEQTNFDDPIQLSIEPLDNAIPRMKDSPKYSPKYSPVLSNNNSLVIEKEQDDELKRYSTQPVKPVLADINLPEAQSIDDNVSVLSAQVISIISENVSATLEKKMQEFEQINQKLSESIESKISSIIDAKIAQSVKDQEIKLKELEEKQKAEEAAKEEVKRLAEKKKKEVQAKKEAEKKEKERVKKVMQEKKALLKQEKEAKKKAREEQRKKKEELSKERKEKLEKSKETNQENVMPCFKKKKPIYYKGTF